MAAGDDEGRALGIDVTRVRLLLILAAMVMTDTRISLSGMVSWVELLISHIVCMLIGLTFPPFSLDVVLMGRSPDLRFIAGLMTADRHVALAALDQYDMSKLYGTAMRVLHGGWCPI
jgi:ABC-type cobalamin transport system permease subunit